MAAKRKVLNVSVTPQQHKLIEKLVKEGGYQSASEVVRAGLRVLQAEREIKLRELRKAIKDGIDSAKGDKWIDVESFMQEWRGINARARQTQRRRKSA